MAQREGREIPPQFQNAPQLIMGLQLYMQAFMDLSSCRSSGMGAGPIPWTSIADYAVAHQFSEDQREDLFYFIRAMDNAYLKFNAPST